LLIGFDDTKPEAQKLGNEAAAGGEVGGNLLDLDMMLSGDNPTPADATQKTNQDNNLLGDMMDLFGGPAQ